MFAGAPVAVGAFPHLVARLCRDDHFVAVSGEVGVEDTAEVNLSGARLWSIVVGEVEMSDAAVEGVEEYLTCVGEAVFGAEVVPEAERDLWEEQAAPAATFV